MANHYRVSPKFHLWARRRGLSDAETRLAFYLLTCEHRNLEGLYRLPKPYIAADLGWQAKKVEENLAAVLLTGLALYDEDAEMVLIPKALKHQSPSTDLQLRGAIAQLERISRTSLWGAFLIACESHCPKLAHAIAMRWPCDGDSIHAPSRASARAGASSISISISNPPLTPPASAGGELDPRRLAAPVNSRAFGTNPRAVAARERAETATAAARLAADALSAPTDDHREAWDRLRQQLKASASESAWGIYLERLELAGVVEGTLVIDGPGEVRSRLDRFRVVIDRCSEAQGVPVRVATEAEHGGRSLDGAAA